MVARLFGAPVLRLEGEVVLTPARLAPLGSTIPSVRARPAADPSQPIVRRLPDGDRAAGGARTTGPRIAEAMVLLEQTSDSLRRLSNGQLSDGARGGPEPLRVPGVPPTDDLLVYCWPQSVEAGDDVAIHASGPSVEVAVEVARVGATREVVRRGTMTVQPQSLGPEVVAEGCDWPAAAHLAVEPEWRSGYYEVVLTHDGHGPEPVEAVAFFVVRPHDDRSGTAAPRPGDQHVVRVQRRRRPEPVPLVRRAPSPVVSFRRPMARGLPPPGRRPGFAGGRRRRSRPDDDRARHAHARGGLLVLVRLGRVVRLGGTVRGLGRGGGLRARRMRPTPTSSTTPSCSTAGVSSCPSATTSTGPPACATSIEAFARGGGNVAFLSGNTACWQVRIEDDGQTLVGYKESFHDDPVLGTDRQAQLTTLWSDALLGRPENAMTGVSFIRGGYHRIGRNVGRGAGGYTVQRPEHWVFDGTGVTYGDLIGADAVTVGYECDGCHLEVRDGLPFPTGLDGTPSDFEILGLAPGRALRPPQRVAPRPRGRAVRDRALRQPGPRRPRPRRGRRDSDTATR